MDVFMFGCTVKIATSDRDVCPLQNLNVTGSTNATTPTFQNMQSSGFVEGPMAILFVFSLWAALL